MNYKTGLSAAGVAYFFYLMSTFSQAEGNEPNPRKDPFRWKTRPFIHELGGKPTLMALIGKNAPKKPTFEKALELVGDDREPYALLIGDFSLDDLEIIKRTLGTYYGLNPNLVNHLEPIIIKYDEQAAGSLPNGAADQKGLEAVALRWVNRKEKSAEGVSIAEKTNADILDAWYGHLLAIPTSQVEYQKIMVNIAAYRAKKRKGGYDILISGDTSLLSESFPHELIHHFIEESPKGIETLRKMLECWDPSSEIGRGSGLANYILVSQAEAAGWIANKEFNLRMLIKLAEENSNKPESERKAPPKEYALTNRGINEDYKRIERAVGNMGAKQTFNLEREIINEVAVPIRDIEQAAVTGEEAGMNRKIYRKSQEILNSGKRLFAELSEAIALLEANMAGMDGVLLDETMSHLKNERDKAYGPPTPGYGHMLMREFLNSFDCPEPPASQQQTIKTKSSQIPAEKRSHDNDQREPRWKRMMHGHQRGNFRR